MCSQPPGLGRRAFRIATPVTSRWGGTRRSAAGLQAGVPIPKQEPLTSPVTKALKAAKAGLGCVAFASVLVAAGCMASGVPETPSPSLPFAVWNDSDAVVLVALVGANGRVVFSIQAHELATVTSVPQIGEVKELVILGATCKVKGTTEFGGRAGQFSSGGQVLVRDGRLAGGTSRLPPEWAVAAERSRECGGLPE